MKYLIIIITIDSIAKEYSLNDEEMIKKKLSLDIKFLSIIHFEFTIDLE